MCYSNKRKKKPNQNLKSLIWPYPIPIFLNGFNLGRFQNPYRPFNPLKTTQNLTMAEIQPKPLYGFGPPIWALSVCVKSGRNMPSCKRKKEKGKSR